MYSDDEPTPDEIRRICAEIQATWTTAEENQRRFQPHRVLDHVPGWQPPGCAADSAGVCVSLQEGRA